jgi:hypothetical protein
MKFKLSVKDTPKIWHNDSPFLTYFWCALSTAFPQGERFFMESVSFFNDRITDPELKREVKAFIRQEAHHTYQHKILNDITASCGFPINLYERNYWKKNLAKLRKHLSPERQLCVTMALEHFTAGFSEEWFNNTEVTKNVDPEVKALWKWHCAEETEHKAVAHDVYQTIDGGYFKRVSTFLPAWFMIIFITFRILYDMLKRDGRLTSWGDNFRGLRYLFGFRGFFTKMIPDMIAYHKPSFHPWDKDDSSLVDEWTAENEGSQYIDLTRWKKT